MRHLAVGDIHGCVRALRLLESFVPFRPRDCLVTLGDYVNRGPATSEVLDWLIDYGSRANLVAIRGNHDIMMMAARVNPQVYERWFEVGGGATLKSYAPDEGPGNLADVPDRHWEFLEETRQYYETQTHFFVHANAYADIPLEEQPDFMLFWEHLHSMPPSPHESGKVMICGHSSQKSGLPLYLGHAICIDTWACGQGWLTCLDVATGQYWQANEQGETRSDWLV